VKVALQGGSLAKHASLSVANLTLNLLKSTWSSFSFPFWSYSRQTSFLAASIVSSVSQSERMDKSLKFSGLSLSTLKKRFVCRSRTRMMWNHILWWHVQLVKCYIKQDWGCYRSNVRECMKTPILGVCDRTRMKP
jgi:hypothetical protein